MNDSQARILTALEIALLFRCGPCPENVRRFGAYVFLTTHFLHLCPHLLWAFFVTEEI